MKLISLLISIILLSACSTNLDYSDKTSDGCSGSFSWDKAIWCGVDFKGKTSGKHVEKKIKEINNQSDETVHKTRKVKGKFKKNQKAK